MATKKKTAKNKAKATKKQPQAKRASVGAGIPIGDYIGYQAAKAPVIVPLPEALKAFDDALLNVQGIRAIFLTHGDEELKANRARRLADASHHLQVAGWNLRESAYHEADK